MPSGISISGWGSMNGCLYVGRVSHSRYRPRPHRFSYGIAMAMVELPRGVDEPLLSGVPALLRRLLPIRRADHLRPAPDRAGRPLRETLAALVARRNGM